MLNPDYMWETNDNSAQRVPECLCFVWMQSLSATVVTSGCLFDFQDVESNLKRSSYYILIIMLIFQNL